MMPTILMCDRTCFPECPACEAYAAEMRVLHKCTGYDQGCKCMECLIEEDRRMLGIQKLANVPWWKWALHKFGLWLAEI